MLQESGRGRITLSSLYFTVSKTWFQLHAQSKFSSLALPPTPLPNYESAIWEGGLLVGGTCNLLSTKEWSQNIPWETFATVVGADPRTIRTPQSALAASGSGKGLCVQNKTFDCKNSSKTKKKSSSEYIFLLFFLIFRVKANQGALFRCRLSFAFLVYMG